MGSTRLCEKRGSAMARQDRCRVAAANAKGAPCRRRGPARGGGSGGRGGSIRRPSPTLRRFGRSSGRGRGAAGSRRRRGWSSWRMAPRATGPWRRTTSREAMALLPARTPEQAEAQREEAGYFRNNGARMRYARYRAAGYQIGSGVMEASCRTVVNRRFDQSGMFTPRTGGTGGRRRRMRWSPCGRRAFPPPSPISPTSVGLLTELPGK